MNIFKTLLGGIPEKCVEAQVKTRGKLDDLASKHGAFNIKKERS